MGAESNKQRRMENAWEGIHPTMDGIAADDDDIYISTSVVIKH